MSTAATDAPRITLLRASASYASRGVDLVALQRHMLEAWCVMPLDGHVVAVTCSPRIILTALTSCVCLSQCRSPPASLSIDRDWLIASVPLEDYVHAAIQDDGEDAERSTEPPTVVAAAASMTSDSVPLASRSRATGHLVAGEPVVTDGDRVFMSISRRGSVVIVGAPPRIRPDRQTHFNPFAALSHASATPLPRDQPVADEDLQIEVNPTQAKFAEFSGGVLRLRSLDADALRILNSCLAQTVNLQFFEGQLDQMHGTIRHIQQTIQQDASKNDSMLSVFRYLSPSAVLSRARQQAAVALLYQHLAGVNAISNHVVLSGLRTTCVEAHVQSL